MTKITCKSCGWVHISSHDSLEIAQKEGISCIRCKSNKFRIAKEQEIPKGVSLPYADDCKLEEIANER